MNSYETSIPRVIFSIAAVAMTAITLAVFVLLPAEMRAYDDPTSTLSGVVTAAAAGFAVRAARSSHDSVDKPVSASIRRTAVERERVHEI